MFYGVVSVIIVGCLCLISLGVIINGFGVRFRMVVFGRDCLGLFADVSFHFGGVSRCNWFIGYLLFAVI